MSAEIPPAARALVEALLDPACYDHPVERVRVVETHLSWVLLTGRFAYKLKKPVDLGFADFSTPEKRELACAEELRLNRRLAPELYLDIVAVRGDPARPRFGGTGPVLEHAVRMREFPEDARLDRVLARGGLDARMMRALGEHVAAFHAGAAIAGPDDPWASTEELHVEAMDNLAALGGAVAAGVVDAAALELLHGWTAESLVARSDEFRRRKREGHVRECHGDMHLANMALVDGRVLVFDGIEFNAGLRWIDTVSEIAFALMDLRYRDRPDLAHAFLSAWLEEGGDYDGLAVLWHYLVYRALVRAKVAWIRARQEGLDAAERESARRDVDTHVDLARGFARGRRNPFLVITCGVSGSGKSTLAEQLVELTGAVRVRSDAERRRTPEPPTGGRYSRAAIDRVYQRMEACAAKAIAAGLPVVVDATFLRRAHRSRFWQLASETRVPFSIVALEAPDEVLARRVAERAERATDPSEATVEVLRRQLEMREPLDAREREFACVLDAAEGLDMDRALRMLHRSGHLPLGHRFHRDGRMPA